MTRAQGTLPKGYDTVEGGTESWDSFDTGSVYTPCKAVYSYDAQDFPWDASRSHVIRTLSFRRDGPYSLKGQSTTGAITKRWAIWLSTHSSRHPAQIDQNHFGRAHGANRMLVYGTSGGGKDVFLPREARPVGQPAGFNVRIVLDTPFTVPASSSSLVLEIRSYSETTTTAGWWRADAVRYSTRGWSPGSFSVLDSRQCVTPAITSVNRSNVLGSSLVRIYRSNQAPGGKIMLSWLGPRLAGPVRLPGTSCDLRVTPGAPLFVTTTASSGTSTGAMDFGPVPVDMRFLGIEVPHQSAIFDNAYPGGIALTLPGATRIGGGFDTTLVRGLSVFSYGVNTAHEHGTSSRPRVVIPDQEVYASFATARHPILRIN